MLVYSNVTDYLPTSEVVGIRVSIHNPATVPFPDVFGYSAPVGTVSSFGLKPVRKTKSKYKTENASANYIIPNNVQKTFARLKPPYGDCLDHTIHQEMITNYIYTGEITVEVCQTPSIKSQENCKRQKIFIGLFSKLCPE